MAGKLASVASAGSIGVRSCSACAAFYRRSSVALLATRMGARRSPVRRMRVVQIAWLT